jgi:sugar (pentulose or hexulose) kinase
VGKTGFVVMEKYIMAIDQGTTGSRVLIVNATGRIIADAYAEFPQIYPRPGWVEHDAEVIWGTVHTLMGRALAAAALTADRIVALGITNQRETTVLWDRKTLAPVHNAIVWQCRRSAGICETLKAAGRSPWLPGQPCRHPGVNRDGGCVPGGTRHRILGFGRRHCRAAAVGEDLSPAHERRRSQA